MKVRTATTLGATQMPIVFKGIDLLVTYEYEPEEPAQHYGPAPYPGAPEQLDVLEVHHKGEDITELLDWQMVEDIAQQVRERME